MNAVSSGRQCWANSERISAATSRMSASQGQISEQQHVSPSRVRPFHGVKAIPAFTAEFAAFVPFLCASCQNYLRVIQGEIQDAPLWATVKRTSSRRHSGLPPEPRCLHCFWFWSIVLAERTGVLDSYSQPASSSPTVRACSKILPCSSTRI